MQLVYVKLIKKQCATYSANAFFSFYTGQHAVERANAQKAFRHGRNTDRRSSNRHYKEDERRKADKKIKALEDALAEAKRQMAKMKAPQAQVAPAPEVASQQPQGYVLCSKFCRVQNVNIFFSFFN